MIARAKIERIIEYWVNLGTVWESFIGVPLKDVTMIKYKRMSKVFNLPVNQIKKIINEESKSIQESTRKKGEQGQQKLF